MEVTQTPAESNYEDVSVQNSFHRQTTLDIKPVIDGSEFVGSINPAWRSTYIKTEHEDMKSVDSMPQLLPAVSDVSAFRRLKAEGKDDWLPMDHLPFNMRIVNLNNFPIAQTVYRTSYRSHSAACVRAKLGSTQNTAKSLDLTRSVIQRFINKEIDEIIQKYITEFFQPALENIRFNNGDMSVTDDHMQTVCRQILEEAKKMYCSESRSYGLVDMADSASDAGSQSDSRPSRHLFGARKRRMSSGSESSSVTNKLKKKARPAHLQGGSGRSTPSRSTKSDSVRREGRLWDPDRLKTDTLFVMGSKANKALGLGATRGRLYIKHPDIFKYGGDQDDKQWLHEHQHMPATGGRTYLLIIDDIREIAQLDEYRNSGMLQMEELVGFTVPEWMLEKMRCQMRLMRTDFGPPASKLLHDITPLASSQEASPANTNTLSPEQDDADVDDVDDDKLITDSPLNATGGFVQDAAGVFGGHDSLPPNFYVD